MKRIICIVCIVLLSILFTATIAHAESEKAGPIIADIDAMYYLSKDGPHNVALALEGRVVISHNWDDPMYFDLDGAYPLTQGGLGMVYRGFSGILNVHLFGGVGGAGAMAVTFDLHPGVFVTTHGFEFAVDGHYMPDYGNEPLERILLEARSGYEIHRIAFLGVMARWYHYQTASERAILERVDHDVIDEETACKFLPDDEGWKFLVGPTIGFNLAYPSTGWRLRLWGGALVDVAHYTDPDNREAYRRLRGFNEDMPTTEQEPDKQYYQRTYWTIGFSIVPPSVP
ncbi:MAG: hypothetical protein WC480_00305 [Patescibacteria group bacterium]